MKNTSKPTRLARPSYQQALWHDLEMGMFIHWAPNVYQGLQGDALTTPLTDINPSELDTDEWIQVAKDLGAKYIVMVAKHVGGFCIWQTSTSEYSIRNTPWRQGKGDIMADISASCHRAGLKLGVYLSPRDDYFGANTGGICSDPSRQTEYDAVYRQQLKELLSCYGEICEVWFDGSSNCFVADILAQYAPQAVVFQSPQASIRWVGNEDGMAHYPAWNSLSQADALTGKATQAQSTPDGDAWLPLECDTTIRQDWFWSPDNHVTLKSVEKLMDIYYRSIGNGAVLILNANPDDLGRIPADDAQRARDFGDEIRRRFSHPVAVTAGKGQELLLEFPKLHRIDHVVLQEDINQGERVRQYSITGFDGQKWRFVAQGTAIGHKRIESIRPVLLSKIRLTIERSVDQPQIRLLAVYGSLQSECDADEVHKDI